MPVSVQLIAALVTTTLLGYAGAIALAGVQVIAEWRSPNRVGATASLLQHGGAALALLGLVYRDLEMGTVGLLMVILSLLIADIGRQSLNPRVETGLTLLSVANLLALTGLLLL